MFASTSYPSLHAIEKTSIKKQGLYTPLPTLNIPWESISMDYMSDLPSTKHGNDFFFVVIDRLSKMEVFDTLQEEHHNQATSKLLFTHFWVHFGIPHIIIFDRDNSFINIFGPTYR
jgi:hypothetical protein